MHQHVRSPASVFRSSQPLFCWEGEPNASRPGIGEHPTVYPGFTSAAGVCPSRAQPTVDAVVRVRRAGQSACARAVVACHRNHVVVREAALRGSSAPPRSEPVAEGFAATGVRYSAREPSRIWECEVRAVAVASCCGVCRCPVRREAARTDPGESGARRRASSPPHSPRCRTAEATHQAGADTAIAGDGPGAAT